MPIQNLPVWTFEPNWTNSVTETFEWNTRILKSVDGSEQRAALRALPWITYEFTVAVAGTMRQYLDQMLVTHGAGTWYLPLFHEASSIDADAPAGSTHWGTIMGIGLSLMLGATVLMASIAYSFQHYFEYQVEEARKISQ